MKKNTELTRVCACGILCALSVVLGKFLIIQIGDSLRLSFGDIPVILSSLAFGIPGGVAVAALSDILGCVLASLGAVNPIITLGQCVVALVPALLVRVFGIDLGRASFPRMFAVICPGFLLGSFVLKSIGLYVYFGTPLRILLLRLPIALALSVISTLVLTVIFRRANGAIISCGGRVDHSSRTPSDKESGGDGR